MPNKSSILSLARKKYKQIRKEAKRKSKENYKLGIGCYHSSPNYCRKCITKLELYEGQGIIKPTTSHSWFLSDWKRKLYNLSKKKKTTNSEFTARKAIIIMKLTYHFL